MCLVVVVLVGATIFDFVVSNRIGVKFGEIVPQVNTHRLTGQISDVTSYFQDGGHDVRPPLRRLLASPPSACYVIGSLYALQLLIHSYLLTYMYLLVADHAVTGGHA